METSPCLQEEDVQEESAGVCGALVFKPSGFPGALPVTRLLRAVTIGRDLSVTVSSDGSSLLAQVKGGRCDRILSLLSSKQRKTWSLHNRIQWRRVV